jgi:hypothetical protein
MTKPELWTQPTTTPEPPSLDTIRQGLQRIAGVGAHTAHIAAVRLEWVQGQGE